MSYPYSAISSQQLSTLRRLVCSESGYEELRGFPCCSAHTGKREKRYRATLPAMVSANSRRSFNTCFLEALNNFDRNDFCITLTFKDSVLDTDRYNLLQNMKKRLQRKYGKHKNKKGKWVSNLKYMIFWGRGDIENQLHVHMLVNKIVGLRFDELCEICRGKGVDVSAYRGAETIEGVAVELPSVPEAEHIQRYNELTGKKLVEKANAHINEIGKDYLLSVPDYEIIERTIWYLYKHWDTLTDEDKKLTKMHKAHWIPSRTLNKVEVTESYDDDETEQPFEKSPYKQLSAYWKAWQKSPEDFNTLVERLNPGRLVYGYRYNNGQSPFYIDEYGQTFFGVELVRIGSKMDYGNKTVIKKFRSGNVEHRYVVDTFTGEVIKEYELDLTTGKMLQVA
ncbi:MAG: hypothetical protein IJ071_12740 [Ruminococcus sp.]|nr:hypothetical protein [Ruminococcus sp.]